MKTSTLPRITGSVKVLEPLKDGKAKIAITSKTARGPVMKAYTVEVHEHGYRLTSCGDGKVYDVPASLDLCDCHDFGYRADQREDHSCKHLNACKALVRSGKLPVMECREVVDFVALEDAELENADYAA